MAGSTHILITPEFRFSYPKLVVPKPFMQNGKAKGDPNYGLQMIFEPEDLERFKLFDEDAGTFVDVDIRKICAQVAKDEWPDLNLKEAVAEKELSWPIVKGDKLAAKAEAKKKESEHYKGMEVISASASQEYPPMLYVTENGKRKQIVRGLDTDEQKAKQLFDVGGNFGFAEVTVKAGDVNGKYVKFYVNSVRFTKAGQRLGGTSMMDRFDGVMGGESDHDATEGLDDEIPF